MTEPNIEVKIWPWKPGDRGYFCMPLKKNIPNPKNDDWKLVSCPVCGRECWESELLREVRLAGTGALCAIRAGINQRS